MEPSGTRCATHPDVPAVGTCERCGDFVCQACVHPAHPGTCTRCGERLPSGIAWEDPRAGALPIRFLKTLRDVALRPKVAFPGPSRPLAALGFAALSGAGLGGTLVGMAGVLLAADSDPLVALLHESGGAIFALAMGLAVVLPVSAILLWTGALAASFALGLASVGRGRGSFAYALRSCGYAQGIALLCVLPPFVTAVASHLWGSSDELFAATHVTWIATSLVWPALSGRVCFWAGRGMGLTSSRAAFAAFGPTLLCTPVAAFLTYHQVEQLLAPPMGLGS